MYVCMYVCMYIYIYIYIYIYSLGGPLRDLGLGQELGVLLEHSRLELLHVPDYNHTNNNDDIATTTTTTTNTNSTMMMTY